ncbi:MAG: hypothetical protein KME03_07120 [Aphanocapsa lilacina HA4352-LM1]|jgi:predicted transposase YdaD|nr:hypothetical protein [Aphanocapsa lilacina HA4352-LM1]
MATYAAFVLNRYGQVPQQVLVLLRDSAASRRVPEYFAQGGLRADYQLVRLWEQDPAPILTGGLVGLMPLVPLMGSQEVEGLLSASVEAVEAGLESSQERNEVLAVTGLLASLRDGQAVAEFFRRRSLMNLLQQTPLFQELTRDIVLETERRSKVQTLLHQLGHRFGSVPEAVATALQAITDPQILDRLSLALLDAPDLDTFRRQLPPD